MASPSVASRSKQPVRSGPDTDDVVLARALEFAAWAKRNRNAVIIGAVLAAVLVGGFIYYRFYEADRAERAAVQFIQVEQVAAAGNPALAERDLTDFIRRFDGTVEADQARLMLARIHLEAGEPAEALPVLQAVEAGADTPVGAQAGLLLGAAQAQAGNTGAAVASYLEVANEADVPYFQEEALTSAALLRQQAGEHAGAAELWRRLVEMSEEGSLQRSIYEMRLAEAEGRALGS